jgi:hypothetical protein
MNSSKVSVLLLALAMSLPASAKSGAARTPDAEYVSALATANRFLHAWQVQDHEAGLLLLTDAAKRQTSEDHLDLFFSSQGWSQEGFEINRGKRLKAGRYEFPVALWQTSAGKNQKPRPRFSEIVVVRTGKDEWAIDKLP